MMQFSRQKLLQTSEFWPGPSIWDFLHLITFHLWIYVLIIDQGNYGDNDEKTPDQEAGQLWLQSGGSQREAPSSSSSCSGG